MAQKNCLIDALLPWHPFNGQFQFDKESFFEINCKRNERKEN